MRSRKYIFNLCLLSTIMVYNHETIAKEFNCPGKIILKENKNPDGNRLTLVVDVENNEKNGKIYLENVDMLPETYMQVDKTDMSVNKTNNGYNLRSNKNFEPKYGMIGKFLKPAMRFSVIVNIDESTNSVDMTMGSDARFTGKCK